MYVYVYIYIHTHVYIHIDQRDAEEHPASPRPAVRLGRRRNAGAASRLLFFLTMSLDSPKIVATPWGNRP